jgi:hypothetical protein
MLLSVLLVQLATAAAADSSAMAAAAEAAPCSSRQAAAAADAGSGSTAAVCDAQELWQSLQNCFAERQSWWGSAGIVDLSELSDLFACKPEMDLLLNQQVEQQLQMFEEQERQEELLQQQQNGCLDEELQQQLCELLGSQPLPATVVASQQQQDWQQQQQRRDLQQQQQQQQQQEEELGQRLHQGSQAANGLQGSMAASPWGPLQQLLCCKAIALLFVLGPFNAYSWLAMDAAAAVAQMEGASIAVEGLGQLLLPHMRQQLMQPNAQMDGLCATAAAARWASQVTFLSQQSCQASVAVVHIHTAYAWIVCTPG